MHRHEDRSRSLHCLGVPSALIYAVEAIILMFYLVAGVLSQFRLRRVAHVE